MKSSLSILFLLLVLSSAVYVSAVHQTVEYGASWDYGRNWTRVWADNSLTSTVAYKTTTITHGTRVAESGTVAPQTAQAFCHLSLWPSDTGENYYYNIWQ